MDAGTRMHSNRNRTIEINSITTYHNFLLTSFVIFWMALPMQVHYQHDVSFSEFDDDAEISQRQLQEHPEWTRHE